MRDYAIVSPTFWTGRTGRAIKAKGCDAIVVALYLVTCPSSSMTGLYYLPIPTLSHETGIPLEGACKALRSLSEAGFAAFDEVNEVVLVHEMARYQIADALDARDNRVKGVIRDAKRYAHSPLFAVWFERYAKPFNLPANEAPKAVAASPSEAPSKPLRSQDQDQDQDQDQEQEQEHGGVGGTPSAQPEPLALAAKPDPKPSASGASTPAAADTHGKAPRSPKSARKAPAPPEDTIPLPGTPARAIYDVLTGDAALRSITAGPGDFAARVSDPGIYPGVDVLAEVKRAALHAAEHPGRYTDGRRYLKGWLARKADDIARLPKPAQPTPQPRPQRPALSDAEMRARSPFADLKERLDARDARR